MICYLSMMLVLCLGLVDGTCEKNLDEKIARVELQDGDVCSRNFNVSTCTVVTTYLEDNIYYAINLKRTSEFNFTWESSDLPDAFITLLSPTNEHKSALRPMEGCCKIPFTDKWCESKTCINDVRISLEFRNHIYIAEKPHPYECKEVANYETFRYSSNNSHGQYVRFDYETNSFMIVNDTKTKYGGTSKASAIRERMETFTRGCRFSLNKDYVITRKGTSGIEISDVFRRGTYDVINFTWMNERVRDVTNDEVHSCALETYELDELGNLSYTNEDNSSFSCIMYTRDDGTKVPGDSSVVKCMPHNATYTQFRSIPVASNGLTLNTIYIILGLVVGFILVTMAVIFLIFRTVKVVRLEKKDYVTVETMIEKNHKFIEPCFKDDVKEIPDIITEDDFKHTEDSCRDPDRKAPDTKDSEQYLYITDVRYPAHTHPSNLHRDRQEAFTEGPDTENEYSEDAQTETQGEAMLQDTRVVIPLPCEKSAEAFPVSYLPISAFVGNE